MICVDELHAVKAADKSEKSKNCHLHMFILKLLFVHL